MVGTRCRKELTWQREKRETQQCQWQHHLWLEPDPTAPESEGKRTHGEDKAGNVKRPAVVVEDAEGEIELAPGQSKADCARGRVRRAGHQNCQRRNEGQS